MLRLESILYKELKELLFKRLTRQKFYDDLWRIREWKELEDLRFR